METLLRWFRKHVMGVPDRMYRANRDPVVLQALRLEKRVDSLDWRPRDFFNAR